VHNVAITVVTSARNGRLLVQAGPNLVSDVKAAPAAPLQGMRSTSFRASCRQPRFVLSIQSSITWRSCSQKGRDKTPADGCVGRRHPCRRGRSKASSTDDTKAHPFDGAGLPTPYQLLTTPLMIRARVGCKLVIEEGCHIYATGGLSAVRSSDLC
jgi:hypothetical protein